MKKSLDTTHWFMYERQGGAMTGNFHRNPSPNSWRQQCGARMGKRKGSSYGGAEKEEKPDIIVSKPKKKVKIPVNAEQKEQVRRDTIPVDWS